MNRLARHAEISAALTRLSDAQLEALLAEATPNAEGIGGTSASLDVAGSKVFVKAVPLTDLELQNERSTANLFQLPNCFHYGVGSAGFGAWRELAALEQTTGWVQTNESQSFPLLHHWRIRPRRPGPTGEDLEKTVAFWDGSPEVRARLVALEQAASSVVLFLEHVPQTLTQWLAAQVALGTDALDAACLMIERCLRADVAFMNARGLLHLDAHFDNILTDGQRLYFADLGLAMSSAFALSQSEQEFFASHAGYDRAYTMTRLVNVLTPLGEKSREAARIVERHAPIAAVMNPFYRALLTTSRLGVFPFGELDRLEPEKLALPL